MMVTKIVNKTPDHVTAEHLRKILDYCTETGVFRRKTVAKGGIGSVAGSLRGDGYIRIGVTCNGVFKSYAAHRLAWLYVHGVMPDCIIDHIDRNRTNNSIGNLRLSDCSENAINTSKKKIAGSSKWAVVSFHKVRGMWRATIRRKGKLHHIGHFKTEDDAAQAYMICAEINAIVRNNAIMFV